MFVNYCASDVLQEQISLEIADVDIKLAAKKGFHLNSRAELATFLSL